MSSNQKIPATFYRSAGGNEPMREWLKGLDKSDRQTIGEDIAYVQYKWPIGKQTPEGVEKWPKPVRLIPMREAVLMTS